MYCKRPTKLSTFHSKNLRRILQIFWPEAISNLHLLAHCNQDSVGTIMRRRWIGNLRPGNISRTPLQWTPEGKRKRGRPKNIWRRTVEGELKNLHHTRSEAGFVAALPASWHNGHELVRESASTDSKLHSQHKGSPVYLRIIT